MFEMKRTQCEELIYVTTYVHIVYLSSFIPVSFS